MAKPESWQRAAYRYALVVLLALLALQAYLWGGSAVETIPYSAFLHALQSGQVAEVTVTDTAVQGSFKQPDATGRPRRFVAARVPADLAATLAPTGVSFRGEPGRTCSGASWRGCCPCWCSPWPGCTWATALPARAATA